MSGSEIRNECLRELAARIDSMFDPTDTHLSLNEIGLLSENIQEIVDTQLSIDLLTEESMMEAEGRVTGAGDLIKRVASEAQAMIRSLLISQPSLPDNILEEIPPPALMSWGGGRVAELALAACSHPFYNMFEGDRLTDFQRHVLSRCTFDFGELWGRMSMLDIAGFAGAPKIFKYLLVNKCPDTEYTEVMCCCGGNSETIHFLENERGRDFTHHLCVRASILYHRHHILHWLLLRGNELCGVVESIVSRNTYAYLLLLKTYRHGALSLNHIELSLKTNSTGILKVLCDLFSGIFVDIPYTLRDEDIGSQDSRVSDLCRVLARHGDHVSIPLVTNSIPDVTYGLLCETACCGNLRGLEYLLDNGFDVNTLDEHGRPLIICAVLSCDVKVVRAVIRRGADLKRKDRYGNGCLWYSVRYPSKNSDITRLLYLNGVRDIDAEELALNSLDFSHPIYQFFEGLRSHAG